LEIIDNEGRCSLIEGGSRFIENKQVSIGSENPVHRAGHGHALLLAT